MAKHQNVQVITARGNWLWSLLITLVVLALGYSGVCIAVFHLPFDGSLPIFVSGAVLAIVVFVIGRRARSIVAGIVGIPFYLIATFLCAPSLIQYCALTFNGETTTAVVTRLVQDPPGVTSIATGCRTCAHTYAYAVSTLDGRPLPGYVGGNTHLDIGEHVQVLVDRGGKVDTRLTTEVNPTIGIIAAILSIGISLTVSRFAILDRKIRT